MVYHGDLLDGESQTQECRHLLLFLMHLDMQSVCKSVYDKVIYMY